MLQAKELLFYTLVALYFLVLSVVAHTTPISPSEAYQFYQDDFSVTAFLMHIGQNTLAGEIGFRLPFILMGILNSFLFYTISRKLFIRKNDAVLALGIYLLLPGVIASTILASDAMIISTLILTFIYLHIKHYSSLSVIPLFVLMFVHWSASFLYLILVIYALIKKEKVLLLVSMLLLLVYFAIGVVIPEESTKSYFFELLGVYATIFSPLVFIYFFYAGYKTLFGGERDIIWYVSFLAFALSLLFSLDEKVRIADFSSYTMIGIIVAVRSYSSSLRVRLKQFQRGYNIMFAVVISSLVVSASSLLLHQPIYKFVGKDRYPIVAPIYEPYDLSLELKSKGANCIDSINERVYYQMKYYGIEKCS
ncbi:MAG: hypothetical protein HF962_06305 [Sulfurovum sp.]|nr:hypothetical protein [Sulfurovum sp.]